MIRSALLSMLLLAPSAALAGQTMTTIMTPGIGAQGASGGYIAGRDYSAPGYNYSGRFPAASIPARPDQVRVGYNVFSADGPRIGAIAYVDRRVAVVESPTSALRFPLGAFRVKRDGLVLGVSPRKFEALAGTYGARR